MSYSLLQVAEAFVRAGELADALDVLNQHCATAPEDDTARRLRAAVRLRLDGAHWLSALDDLDALAAPTADDFVQRSVIRQCMGDLPGAVAAIRQARALSPDDDRVTGRMLDLLLAAGLRAEAHALLDLLPPRWRWLERAGELAALDGDPALAAVKFTAALDDLRRQLDTKTNPVGANLNILLLAKRAAACLASDAVDQAEADYALLETMMPTDAAFPFFRGLAQARRGDPAGGADRCRAALARANDRLRAELLAALDSARDNGLRQRVFA